MPLFKALVCQQSPSSAAMMTFYDVDKRSSRYLQEDRGKRMHTESNVKVACINVQARSKCKMRWGGGGSYCNLAHAFLSIPFATSDFQALQWIEGVKM